MGSVIAEYFRVIGARIARETLFSMYLIVIRSHLPRSGPCEKLPPCSPFLPFAVALARD
jgi:hypothetical protein